MSSWHSEIYGDIEAVVKSDCTVEAGMSAVVAECARHRPHPDWERFGALDVASDLEHLRGWLTTACSTPPDGSISGLWFGLFNPVYEGEDQGSADIYVSGSPYDPANGDWVCAVSWKPRGAYARSRVLKEVFDISYGEEALSYVKEGVSYYDKAVLSEHGERFLMNDGEYPLCLAYGALAVRRLATELDPRVPLGDAQRRALFVGFDSGDLICIGELTGDGLQFSRNSFDWAA